MTDVTSTSFGLIIAFLLPGLTAFYSAVFWSTRVQNLFSQFVTSDSNGGRFLIVALVSLIVGLELSIFRWAIFEKWICRKDCLTSEEFASLRREGHLTAFRAAVDEHYRYHQFWGGMTVAIPLYAIGYIQTSLPTWPTVFGVIGLIVVWVATAIAAKASWSNYVNRSRSILKEVADA